MTDTVPLEDVVRLLRQKRPTMVFDGLAIAVIAETLDAHRQALQDAGYWIAPMEPEGEMALLGARSLRDTFGYDNQSERATQVYRAMRDAALGKGGE